MFQVNATDEIGVAGVSLILPGGEPAPFIPADELPEAIREQFGATGNFLFPILVPPGTPSGTLSFGAEVVDSAGNPTAVTVEAQIVPTLDAFVFNMMPGSNNFSLPLVPKREPDIRLGMNARDFISNLRQLTDDDAHDSLPSFDSGHTQVTFVSDRDSPGVHDVFTMKSDGSEQANLTSTDLVDELDPVFVQGDAVIAFVSDEGAGAVVDGENQGPFSLSLMAATDPGVVTPVEIATGTAFTSFRHPAPSPDGTKLAITAFDEAGVGHVAVLENLPSLNAAGSAFSVGPATLVDLGLGANPVFSPDGSMIAFDQAGDIWTMQDDGTGQLNLTDSGAVPSETDPAWSGNGMRIAFVREVGGGSELFAMNADGANQLSLTDTSATNRFLSNDASGYDRLVFASNRDGDWDIYAIEPRLLAATEAIWWYNALESAVPEEDRWHVFTPGEAPDDLDVVQTGRGYWAITKELDATLAQDGFEWDVSAPLAPGLPETPASLSVSYFGTFLQPGRSVPPTYPVVGGGGGKWNQIGYHGETPLQVTTALQTLESPERIWGALFQFDNLIEFELGNGDEEAVAKIILGAFRRLLANDDMTPGLGFWIFMIEDGAIVAGGGGTQE